MEIKRIDQPLFNLVLTVREAQWLATVMQNPLHGVHMHQEDAYDKKK